MYLLIPSSSVMTAISPMAMDAQHSAALSVDSNAKIFLISCRAMDIIVCADSNSSWEIIVFCQTKEYLTGTSLCSPSEFKPVACTQQIKLKKGVSTKQ